MQDAIIAKEAACRVALEKASNDWQTFKREYSVFTGKFDPAKEEALWKALTDARIAHEVAYQEYSNASV